MEKLTYITQLMTKYERTKKVDIYLRVFADQSFHVVKEADPNDFIGFDNVDDLISYFEKDNK